VLMAKAMMKLLHEMVQIHRPVHGLAFVAIGGVRRFVRRSAKNYLQ
jgi:hypothetical protein